MFKWSWKDRVRIYRSLPNVAPFNLPGCKYMLYHFTQHPHLTPRCIWSTNFAVRCHRTLLECTLSGRSGGFLENTFRPCYTILFCHVRFFGCFWQPLKPGPCWAKYANSLGVAGWSPFSGPSPEYGSPNAGKARTHQIQVRFTEDEPVRNTLNSYRMKSFWFPNLRQQLCQP